MARHRRVGFSKLDVAVATVVVFIFVVVILPAFFPLRSKSRQTKCIAHISQIGKALIQYENQHKAFVPGIISWDPSPSNGGEALCRYSITGEDDCTEEGLGKLSIASGLTLILPFVGERMAYDLYNFDKACCSSANATATSVLVQSFLCPSNPRGSTSVMGPARDFYAMERSLPPAGTDYALCMGANVWPLLTCNSPIAEDDQDAETPWFPPAVRPAAGTFYLNSSVTMKRMSSMDGSSNTILAGDAARWVGLGVNDKGSIFPTGPFDMTPKYTSTTEIVDTPWSQGYIGSPRGKGGYGCVLAASAFDAWYNRGPAIPTADGLPEIPTGGLMPAYREDAAFNARIDKHAGGGFTPIKMQGGELKLVRGTVVERNDELATDVRDWSDKSGKVDVLKHTSVSIGGFRSFHPNLVIVVFGDGHTRKIAQDIDPEILVGLTTFAGLDAVDVGRRKR